MFSTSLSFYHPFVYRSSSWRLYMVLPQGFLSFFNCSSRFLSESRSIKLYSKINMVLNTCLFWGVQTFFILHFEVKFFLRYLLRWCYVILDNFHSRFAIHMLSRMRYFKSINLFVGVILGYISPKAFPKQCCYCGAYQWSKFSPILSAKAVFISSLILSKHLFALVAGCHLIVLRCFP